MCLFRPMVVVHTAQERNPVMVSASTTQAAGRPALRIVRTQGYTVPSGKGQRTMPLPPCPMNHTLH